jgi:hypothetical protein
MHMNVFDIFTMVVEKHVPPYHALQLNAHIKAYGEEMSARKADCDSWRDADKCGSIKLLDSANKL